MIILCIYIYIYDILIYEYMYICVCVYIYIHTTYSYQLRHPLGPSTVFPWECSSKGRFFWLSVKRRSASPDALQSTMAAGQMSFEGWRSTDSWQLSMWVWMKSGDTNGRSSKICRSYKYTHTKLVTASFVQYTVTGLVTRMGNRDLLLDPAKKWSHHSCCQHDLLKEGRG